MTFDYETLTTLRKNHPAWRLLTADHCPLIASFLYRVFIAPNQRTLSRAVLASALEDYLYTLRQTQGDSAFPRSAEAYLDEWAAEEKGWLRKFYPKESDEIHYDLTPSVEKAVRWIEGLMARTFIGTESRLMTIFELLRQMVQGAEADQEVRIRELEKRKVEIETELMRVRSGHLDFLNDTALKDRFQQIVKTARELLSDFREVEYNFRMLDQKIREQIALWEGSKGKLIEAFFGERDVIAETDQGKSFNAFWDLLMSPLKQEELSTLLNRVFELKAVQDLFPDSRFKRIHYDWLEAGEHTQRTVAKLSSQLRRYLDDQTFLENKRIMQVIQCIETHALLIREAMPENPIMEIDAPSPDIVLPMERPLYKQPVKPVVDEEVLLGDASEIPEGILREPIFVDREMLKTHIRRALQEREQVTLMDILEEHPLEKGMAELVIYLVIAADDNKALFDETTTHQISFYDPNGRRRRVSFPAVIFAR